jgi:hypothetical protein
MSVILAQILSSESAAPLHQKIKWRAVYFFDEILALPKFHRKNTPPSKYSFPAAEGGVWNQYLHSTSYHKKMYIK